MMKVTQFLSRYRWPAYLVGLLVMSITAQGILVYVATRRDAPQPMSQYYQQSLHWDADEAVKAASAALKWQVQLEVPQDSAFDLAERRPVDLTVHDRDGAPVTGLVGRLFAIRPAETRMNSASDLVALPHAPGHYRTLARLPVAGLWELHLDVHLGNTPFVYTARVNVLKGANQP